MAEAASFGQSNLVLGKPEGYTDEECSPLCVYRSRDDKGTPFVISCWKVTKEELKEINKTGRIWLWVHGITMPPATVSGHNPFEPV